MDAKKIPKGLPSHWGAKVRHKPRQQVAGGKKAARKRQAGKGGDKASEGGNTEVHNRKRKGVMDIGSAQVS